MKPRTDREAAGVARYASKLRSLSDDEVREVRRRLEVGETQWGVARSVGLPQSCISAIKTGKTYRDVA